MASETRSDRITKRIGNPHLTTRIPENIYLFTIINPPPLKRNTAIYLHDKYGQLTEVGPAVGGAPLCRRVPPAPAFFSCHVTGTIIERCLPGHCSLYISHLEKVPDLLHLVCVMEYNTRDML